MRILIVFWKCLAHPGRMSAKGSGLRPIEMQSMCPSSVPVDMGGSEGNKKVRFRFTLLVFRETSY